jgi:cytochrome b
VLTGNDHSLHRVWDLPVRIFHWTLLLAFVGAYLTHRLGIEYFKYHLWCGYTVVVLVAFRIVWGVVGPQYARFTDFLHHPVTAIRYGWDWLRGREQPFAGHNPLGGLMVVALLIALFVQASTGLVANDEILNTGPLYGYVSAERSLAFTSLHRQLFYWILAAVILHVLAVVAHLVFKGENLIKAMITGRKHVHGLARSNAEIDSSRTGLAVVIAALLTVLLSWLIAHAPTVTGPFDSSF